MHEKAPTSMHSMRLEPAKLILIGTRTTCYQATGDAGVLYSKTTTLILVLFNTIHFAIIVAVRRSGKLRCFLHARLYFSVKGDVVLCIYLVDITGRMNYIPGIYIELHT